MQARSLRTCIIMLSTPVNLEWYKCSHLVQEWLHRLCRRRSACTHSSVVREQRYTRGCANTLRAEVLLSEPANP